MQQQGFLKYIKNLYKTSGIVGKLIAANTAVFLVFLTLSIIEKLFVIEGLTFKIKYWFMAPGDISQIIYRPWVIVTQLFTHGDFGHFALNMIAFYFIGRMFIQFFGEKRLISTYFLGGIFAYVVHVVAYFIFPVYASADTPQILGASGAVFAMFAAIVAHKPDLKVKLLFLPSQGISLTLIFGIYILFTLIGLMKPEGEDNTAHFAHLGGAIFGVISVINVNSPKSFMNRFERFLARFKWPTLSSKKKPKMKVYKQDDFQKMDDDNYRTSKAESQELVDGILDKISKKGYEGLTKKEKEILFNESKRK